MTTDPVASHPMLTAEDLLAGSQAIHEVIVPQQVLKPGEDAANGIASGRVRLRPLNIAILTLISRAASDDPSLIPLLTVKEGLVEPALTLDQIRRLHVGLLYFLVTQINMVSGLSTEGETLTQAASSPLSRAHLLLAKHFGWTPEQVQQLTPGQVAVYLAGIERLLQLEEKEVPD